MNRASPDGTGRRLESGLGRVQPDQFSRPRHQLPDGRSRRARSANSPRPTSGTLAILLVDQIYTRPRLTGSHRARRHRIEGNFSRKSSPVTRVLSAARSRPASHPSPSPPRSSPRRWARQPAARPPRIRLHRLRHRDRVHVVGYYFMFGFVAIVAMAINLALLLVGAPSSQAAFSLPGIAGIVPDLQPRPSTPTCSSTSIRESEPQPRPEDGGAARLRPNLAAIVDNATSPR